MPRLLVWLSRIWRLGRGRPVASLLLMGFSLMLVAPSWLPFEIPNPFEPMRLALYDRYQRLAPRERLSGPVTIVEIDEASLKQIGAWPWPRDRLAALLEAIGRHQPAAIGLDMFLPEPDSTSPEALAARLPAGADKLRQDLLKLPPQDKVLAATLRSMPYVVLGAAGFEFKTLATSEGILTKAEFLTHGGDLQDVSDVVRHFPYVLASLPALQAAAAGQALLSVDLEQGIVRRVPLLATVGPSVIPGLAAEMMRVALGEKTISIDMDFDGIARVGIGDFSIPTQPNGEIWIHFARRDEGRYLSASAVLDGSAPADMLTNKLVLVGLTGSGLIDNRVTPRGDYVPGIDIQAQVLESLFDQHYLQRPPWMQRLELAAFLLGGLLLIWAVPHLRPRIATLLASILFITLLGAGLALFRYANLLFDAATLFGSLNIIFGSLLGTVFIEADRDRRAAERALQFERESSAKLAGELDAARRIQLGSLPQASRLFADETRFELDALLEPARHVGGDLYDFFLLDEKRLFFVIGDVSGKGLPAALFMAVTKALAKSLALRNTGSVGDILQATDVELARENPETLFVTMVAGILDADSGRLELSNAGHDAPWRITAAGTADSLVTVGGPPLCVLENYPFESSAFQLVPGDALCLITDGVTEAMNSAGELYGSERLALLLKAAPQGAGAIVAALRKDVRQFVGETEAADDLTVLALRWNGPAGAGRE
ncbi:MAG: CHASE2 domain-containing protein [Sulfuritalea sp.]|nr:CHASE2 domain-containing protein [Sulfuritalea sp.]